jgi:hypothetical protein
LNAPGTSEQDSLRDLELIILGAAFVKGESRDKVLAALPKGAMESDAGELLDAIRNQDAKSIEDWLIERKCKWDKSQDCIQAIVGFVVETRQRKLIAESLKGLAFLAATAPFDETKNRAATLLKMILEMP